MNKYKKKYRIENYDDVLWKCERPTPSLYIKVLLHSIVNK